MNDRLTKLLPLFMFAGLILGAACGYLLPELSLGIDFIGRLFMGVLRFIVVPLLIASAVTGLASLAEGRLTARISLAFFSYILATTFLAVAVAVGVSLLFAPDFRFSGASGNPVAATWTSVSDALGDIIPANPLRAIAEGKYLGLVLLGALLGAGLAALGVRGRSVLSLFRGLHDGLLKVVHLVLLAAPVGIFSLVAAAVAQQGQSITGWLISSGAYLGTSLIALAIFGVVFLTLIVWYVTGRHPWSLYTDLSEAFLTALGTGSKAVTFPVTSQCLTDRSDLDSRAISAVLPLGTVVNLGGSAIVMVTGTMFVAQAFGVGLGWGSILALAVLSVILSLAAAGLPASMLLAAPVLFGAVGLTAEQMALAIPAVAALDWLIDRAAAVVNVGSDGVAVAVVSKTLEGTAGSRPIRTRRTSRDDSGQERRGRRPKPDRAGESRPTFSGADRRQSGTRGRGRSDYRPGGKPHPGGDRTRQQSDSSENSPFQIRAGRTPAFGSVSERPASEVERPDSGRDRSERREHRVPHEGSPDGRRTSGHPRARSERPEGQARGPRRSPEPAAEAPDIPEVAVDVESRRVSREAVAKDLARISAQLGKAGVSPAPSESQPRTDSDYSDEKVSEPFESDDARTVEAFPRSEETIADDTPVAPSERLFWDDDIDNSDSGDSEQAVSESEPVAAEPETPTSFGRRRAYRGAAFRQNDDTPADEPEEPAVDSRAQGFSTEDVSFGRAKRKRTRR